MTKAQWWLAWAAVLTSVGCSDDSGGGGSGDNTTCGAGTVKQDGVCVPVGGGDGSNDDGSDEDGTDGDGSADGTDGVTCGSGTVDMDGECVPAPLPALKVDGFEVTEVRMATRGRTLTGGADDPEISTFHPIDVTVTVRYEGDPATIPLLVGLGESGTSAEGFCLLGGLSIAHTGTGEASASGRVFLSQDCLRDNSEDDEGASATQRTMVPVVMVDPDETLNTTTALPEYLIFSAAKQTAAINALTAYNAALVAGQTPADLSAEDRSLAKCKGAYGTPGTCALDVEVKESDGVDFELSALNLASSVLVLNKCFSTQQQLDTYANGADLPTGYVCNRSIVRGLDENGDPLPEGNAKDYTYGAADIDVDTTVIAYGMDDSPVESADELMGMGSMTEDGFKLDVKPEDIANNALGSDDSYTVRYFLRPGSVSLGDPGTSVAKKIADEGGLSALVTAKKLLPIYLHAQGEQAKADEEGSPSGQTPTSPEETVAIPLTPTEYNHGLYVENDCGRFNDPTGRPDDYREGTPACDRALNPRDELLYGDFDDETEFFVVACLEAAPDTTLPDSDDLDNNCVEQPIRIARVVPREAQFAAQNPGDPNPFEEDEDDVAKPGFTQDELFAAGDSGDGYSASYDYDQALGNEHVSFNVHAHTRNSISLPNGASTDNEAKLYLRSGTLDFSLDLVRIWAQAAARTIVVGSYYDYGLSFFGIQYMGERKELEFHKEWDWNITKSWEKTKSIWVKVAFIDVGFKAEGQLGFRIDLDVVARELPGADQTCELGAGSCDCATPECSALKTLYPTSEAVGEASITLTPYGNIKANVYAAVSVVIVRAGAGGELTIADIGVPAKAAVNWGLLGSVRAPLDGTLRLAAWANLQLQSTFLKGRLYLFAENRSVQWCKKWGIPYPCGFGWSRFWDMTLASWDGWTYNQLLWASPIYTSDLTRNGLTTPVADIQGGVDYKMQVKHSNKCGDAPSQNAYQWDCHGGNWQKWRFVDEGNGVYRIVNTHTGRCLDAEGGWTHNGGNVHTWACHGGNNQKFRLEKRGDAYVVKFVHSGKCLDVAGVSYDNGGNWHQWDCHYGNNQLFKITRW